MQSPESNNDGASREQLPDGHTRIEHHSSAAVECGVLLGQLLTAAREETGVRYPVVLHLMGIDQATAGQWVQLANRQEKKGASRSGRL